MWNLPDLASYEPVLEDLFTDADGTALAAHTPNVGGPWTDSIAGWEIQGNKASAANNPSESIVPVGLRNLTAIFGIDLNGATDGSITIRLQNTGDDTDFNVKITWEGAGDIRVYDNNQQLMRGLPDVGTFAGTFTLKMAIGNGKFLLYLDNVLLFAYQHSWPPGVIVDELRINAAQASGNKILIDSVLIK